MKTLFKVLLVFLGVLGWWAVWQEGELAEENEFIIHSKGVSDAEGNSDGLLLDIEGEKYLVKSPFARRSTKEYLTNYYFSKKLLWLNGRFIEGENLREEGFDDTKKIVFDARVKFSIIVDEHVNVILNKHKNKTYLRESYSIESEYLEFEKIHSRYGERYLMDNNSLKFTNEQFVVACYVIDKDYFGGQLPCRFRVFIGEHVMVRIMFHHDRLVDWNKFINEIDKVLSAISYVGNKSDIKEEL